MKPDMERLKELSEDSGVYPPTEQIIESVLGLAVPGKALVDKSGNLIYCNDYFVNTLGYTREELIDKPISLLVPVPEHHQQVLDWFAKSETIILRNVEAIHKTKGIIKITVGIVKQDQNAAVGMVLM